MSVLVVDASVAAKWFLEEVHSRAARRVLEPGNELFAPDFLLLEIDSVLWKRLRRGELTPRDCADARLLLRQLPITFHPFAAMQDSAYEIAVRADHSVYDCLYVALAVLLDGRLITADRRLANAFADDPASPHVQWIEEMA